MRRRTVCASVGGAVALLPGCSGVLTEFGSGTSLGTGRIEGTEFEAGTHMEPLFTCWQDGVTVSRIGAKNRIRIAGQIESGGRSCMETVLQTVGIDEDSDTLVVVVADRRQQGASSCTLEEALVRYDATVTLKDTVPNRVRVRHRSELGRGGNHDQFDETIVFETGEREARTVSC